MSLHHCFHIQPLSVDVTHTLHLQRTMLQEPTQQRHTCPTSPTAEDNHVSRTNQPEMMTCQFRQRPFALSILSPTLTYIYTRQSAQIYPHYVTKCFLCYLTHVIYLSHKSNGPESTCTSHRVYYDISTVYFINYSSHKSLCTYIPTSLTN